MPVFHLYAVTYVSTAVKPFSSEELDTLLAASRQRNFQAGISGMLLYHAGCFLQTFEGPIDAVQGLKSRIALDPRHRNMTIVGEGMTDQRDFAAWTMGFKRPNDAEVKSRPTYRRMLEALTHDEQLPVEPTLARKLFLSFLEKTVA